MSQLVTFLAGKKTYGLVAVAVVLTGLKALGYISDGTYNLLMTLTGAGTVATFRAAVGKVGTQALPVVTTPQTAQGRQDQMQGR